MRSPRSFARQRLDQRVGGIDLGPRPPRGWVRAVREALGMTTAELGRRMGVTQSAVSQLERSEEAGTIRVENLERAARALNCRLQYVLVPNEPLEEMVQRQARALAQERVDAVTHTMALEDQAPDPEFLERMVDGLARSLVDRRHLWVEPEMRVR